ncbi:MAG: glutathione S-transferase C-terminal domain-containing protein [Devosiaceae bacterium]|nr:glutathione S-transferase C-terminal domain-containing protein [Devosiaceae bacterium MH13]
MKLYTAAGACCLHVQIVAREAGVPFELELIDLSNKLLADGRHLGDLTPKGYIPLAELPSGEVITEGVVISQWIAEQNPEVELMPAVGSLHRLRALEWAHFIGTEIHTAFGPLFGPSSDDAKRAAIDAVATSLGAVEHRLAAHVWLVGDRFTLVDAYLFNVMTWAKPAGIDLAPFPGIDAHMARMRTRRSVEAALIAEGLLKRAAA